MLLQENKQIDDFCTPTGQVPHSWLRTLLTILSYLQSYTMFFL